MIQRIQSIWLFLGAVSLGLILFLPVFSSGPAEATGLDDILITVTTILGVLAGIVAIFLYNNRALQMRVTRFALTISGAVLGILVYYFIIESGKGISPGIGFFLPIVSSILFALGFRGIKKDDDLVKSADRIR